MDRKEIANVRYSRKFEYKMVYTSLPDLTVEQMNGQGSQGWELTSAYKAPINSIHYPNMWHWWFKREIFPQIGTA